MHIEKLSLINFKNYEELSLDFSENINCLLGKNGSGKTNLIDAIYYLCMTKSAFNTTDGQNINFDGKYFSIKGQFNLYNKTETVICTLQEGRKKVIKRNGIEYEKMSDHVGEFPVVLIAPDDTDLVRMGSELRRKFFDMAISQTSREYLNRLIDYNRYLKQRNSLLKKFAETGKVDYNLLEVYDDKMIPLAGYIFKARDHFVARYLPVLTEIHEIISSKSEAISIHYDSGLKDGPFGRLLKNSKKKDLALQRTTTGVHKDDYNFEIDNRPLKKFGSQGQMKSFIFSLKLAYYQVLAQAKEIRPILLMDDLFDKLDKYRVKQLLDMINEKGFGQVFISDARKERTMGILESTKVKAKYFDVHDGKIDEI